MTAQILTASAQSTVYAYKRMRHLQQVRYRKVGEVKGNFDRALDLTLTRI